ncbi:MULTISPECIES: TolC family protein [Acidobacterium]|uniref:Outer membrane efflux protein n=1 Tax=Acidobacterium capsulatum (strain ATCC 51196 / DSM 11244 / BCRC 80197 / JCM 7670 / NBRC 15755 / NCIMB 13165 / 161) TaxID=240015 RepID=C1F7X1_ACIC5|nr:MULTISPECIES: TolC family protein [Acidobacterium]ACO34064.1 outer membrane efflux protein [Acidobacterium capsulatum ATCC 51196]HCT59334.1 TolC family protein [Acidobacterium sp.]
MKFFSPFVAAAVVLGLATGNGIAQKAPAAPGQIWQPQKKLKLNTRLPAAPMMGYAVSSQSAYTLAELIDLAEQHNPATRLAWQQAKARAAQLGIARSEWYPTLAALAVANTSRVRVLLNSAFYRQTYGSFSPELHAEYLVLDFGGRSGAIQAAKWNLLAANLSFNDTHRRIIFQVMSAYYRLLNAQGLLQAAEVSLRNAQAVEGDVQDRLNHGLATKPDLLEAQAATAQAEYDLQSATGEEQIAHGNLATVLELPPDTDFQVQPIGALELPAQLAGTVKAETQRALKQRPDLEALIAKVKSANAVIRQQRSSYFPTLNFSGNGGLDRQYGAQDQLVPGYASGETWDASLELKWTLFDGGRREHQVAEALAQKAAAQAQIDTLQDDIANQVWTAHTNVETALRQRQAAGALVTSAEQSYEATRDSYNYGVRNILDVIASQKALAQARAEDVTARAQLLLQTANLAFQTGDLIAASPGKTGP